MFSVLRRKAYSICCKRSCFLLKSVESNLDALNLLITSSTVRSKITYKPAALREGPQPSRYHPGSRIEASEEHIESILSSRISMDADEWEEFKLELLSENEVITNENFATVVMNCILNLNNLDLGHSFLKYLENCNTVKPNFLTYLKYVSLCSKNENLVDQNLILDTLNKVKGVVDNVPVLDMKTAEYTIEGLCATDKWRESFHYLDKVVTKKPTLVIRSALACAAIKNKDERLAWEILTNWIKIGEAPHDKVIQAFFVEALGRLKTNPAYSITFVKKVFEYMQTRDIIISDKVAKVVENYFESHPSNWSLAYTKINRKGVCESCGHNLKLKELDNEEFNILKDAFLKRVVQKSDVFINTNPREFDKYLRYIENYKPFHIVVDGLNAAYTCPEVKSRNNLAFQLYKVVKLLSGKSRHILVFGRKHMQYWPSRPMKKLSDISHVFFTDNISQDDPFVIYAGLASGPHTFFLSSDLMRDHMSRLNEPYLIQLFKRWQQSHQIYLTADDKGVISFIEPLRYSIHAQGKLEMGWHIPFDDKLILEPYEELNNWLCIKKDLTA